MGGGRETTFAGSVPVIIGLTRAWKLGHKKGSSSTEIYIITDTLDFKGINKTTMYTLTQTLLRNRSVSTRSARASLTSLLSLAQPKGPCHIHVLSTTSFLCCLRNVEMPCRKEHQPALRAC